jgi:hypothetical protein
MKISLVCVEGTCKVPLRMIFVDFWDSLVIFVLIDYPEFH